MKYTHKLPCGYKVELISRREQIENFDNLVKIDKDRVNEGGLETIAINQFARIHGINPTCSEDFVRCPSGVYYDGSHKCYDSDSIAEGLDICLWKYSAHLPKHDGITEDRDDLPLWQCKFACIGNNDLEDAAGLSGCENYRRLGDYLK